ncbi:MAG: PAS domain S-box protein [Campylobacterales bacterium]|nr:PAS domain S-box protein [Campylobacterales bacterium]
MNKKFDEINFYKNIFSNVDIFTILADVNGRVVFVNDYTSKRVGISCDEFETMTIWDINIIKKDLNQIKELFNTIIQNKEVIKFENRQQINGELICIKWSCNILNLNSEQFVLFHGIDITKEIAKENELELYKKAIEFSSCGITIADCKQEDMPLIYVNSAFSKITGYEKEEGIGKNCRYLQQNDRKQEELQFIRDAIKHQQECRAKIRNYRKDGTLFWNMLDIAPIFDVDGNLEYYVGVQTDITKEKMLEEQLKELNINLKSQVDIEVKKRLEQERLIFQQSKLALMGEMLSLITHQWKQPLNIINLIAEYINLELNYGESIDSEYLVKSMNDINKNILFLTNTIDDFRQFLKPDKEKIKIDVEKSINDVISLLYIQFKSLNVHIDFKIEENVKYETIGYNNEFKHVILNLINNAKESILEKYGSNTKIPTPSIFIRVYLVDKKIGIDIEDLGTGFRDDVLNNLFQQHFTTKGQNGTGLGLFISKMIIEESMNGSISATNSKNGGALFNILVPLVS